jgi:hypothetical protein
VGVIVQLGLVPGILKSDDAGFVLRLGEKARKQKQVRDQG